jgi:hypothetical protein
MHTIAALFTASCYMNLPADRFDNIVNVVHQKYVHQSGILVLLCFCIQIILQSLHDTHGNSCKL